MNRLCKVVSLSSTGTFYLPKEAREHLGIPEGETAKISVHLADQKGEKIVILKVVR